MTIRTTEELLKDAEAAAALGKDGSKGSWVNEELIALIAELSAKLREREEQREALDKALDALVGTNGCLGWIIRKENIDDALLFRGGRLPIKNFAKEFQPMLYEIIHSLHEAKQVLNQQRPLPTPPKKED